MKNSNFFGRIFLGFKDYPLQFLKKTLLAYGSIWGFIAPLITFFPITKHFFLGLSQFIILIIISILVGLYRNAVPTEIEFKYNNQVIKIIFGDIFDFDGYQVIPVSRFFFETQVIPNPLLLTPL